MKEKRLGNIELGPAERGKTGVEFETVETNKPCLGPRVTGPDFPVRWAIPFSDAMMHVEFIDWERIAETFIEPVGLDLDSKIPIPIDCRSHPTTIKALCCKLQ
ncbi:hypothetical protein PoB_001767800 [Plakobranchus ocellatus]|uniref:Uncharacterized protein n=1 Tax=Plakobranchus ocellatus TaxID=259542 RepID=A0AAV3Z8V5_9GAST|nr:hypothetical protein PoB_001767800 [Plakobranchus ocellatus]